MKSFILKYYLFISISFAVLAVPVSILHYEINKLNDNTFQNAQKLSKITNIINSYKNISKQDVNIINKKTIPNQQKSEILNPETDKTFIESSGVIEPENNDLKKPNYKIIIWDSPENLTSPINNEKIRQKIDTLMKDTTSRYIVYFYSGHGYEKKLNATFDISSNQKYSYSSVVYPNNQIDFAEPIYKSINERYNFKSISNHNIDKYNDFTVINLDDNISKYYLKLYKPEKETFFEKYLENSILTKLSIAFFISLFLFSNYNKLFFSYFGNSMYSSFIKVGISVCILSVSTLPIYHLVDIILQYFFNL